jgi:RNA polymerase sigma factor (sigma-70 family)
VVRDPDIDERAEALVRNYGRLIAAAVTRVGRGAVRLIREDVEQDVLIAIWRQLDQGREIEHPTSYIYRAALRATVRAVRRRQGREGTSLTGHDAPGGGDPEMAFEAKRRVEAVEASLATLAPERARAVRAHLAGLDVAEIRTMQGWSYQKARNLIARGMADLRESLRSKGIHG